MAKVSKDEKSYFTKSKYVKELTPKDFDGLNTAKLLDRGCCAVLFYADWCPHCKVMKDEWEEFAKMAGFMQVYAFNCAQYMDHLDKMKTDMPGLVQSFPTIIFYSNGKPTEAYKGDRQAPKFLKASMEVCQGK